MRWGDLIIIIVMQSLIWLEIDFGRRRSVTVTTSASSMDVTIPIPTTTASLAIMASLAPTGGWRLLGWWCPLRPLCD